MEEYSTSADSKNIALSQAYWAERRRFLGYLKRDSRIRRRNYSQFLSYFIRRVLWAFGFFPVFLALWIPLVMAKFNLVVLMVNLRPLMDDFINATPNIQASMIDTVLIAWLSIGVAFAIFDLILTPYQSPYKIELDTHMRAWTIANGVATGEYAVAETNVINHSRPSHLPSSHQ